MARIAEPGVGMAGDQAFRRWCVLFVAVIAQKDIFPVTGHKNRSNGKLSLKVLMLACEKSSLSQDAETEAGSSERTIRREVDEASSCAGLGARAHIPDFSLFRATLAAAVQGGPITGTPTDSELPPLSPATRSHKGGA